MGGENEEKRPEMMLGLLFAGACVVFGVAYKVYGGWISRALGIDDARPTPAVSERDGVDYEPGADAVVFGHHFSSIAGAGPIVGPITAAFAFGWLPAYLWILLGAVFIGGVQDFTTMVASIRPKGESLAEIGKRAMGPFTYRLFLLFILLVLIYVIIVFLDMTAATFAPGGSAEDQATGGAVAMASVLYIAVAVLFSVARRYLRLPLWLATVVFVPMVFLGLWAGMQWPLAESMVPAFLGKAKYFWSAILLAYCLAASVLPVWVLLQPRDYLSSFLLYACLGAGVVGILASPWTGAGSLQWPALRAWSTPNDGFIFPALCVMIACGAVSGFHAMIASGTTSKQLAKETSAQKVGMGSMLIEGVLALLALAAVMILKDDPKMTPANVFAAGLAKLFSPFGMGEGALTGFAMLAVSTFVLTTLDSCTRLSRIILQELLGVAKPGVLARVLLTCGVLLLPVLVCFKDIPGPGGAMMPAWKAVWPAFGATNQLMGAMALLMVFGWLRSEGRKSWFVGVPMVFMFAVTLSALAQIIVKNFAQGGSALLGGLSTVLFVLAVVVLADIVRHRGKPKYEEP